MKYSVRWVESAEEERGSTAAYAIVSRRQPARLIDFWRHLLRRGVNHEIPVGGF